MTQSSTRNLILPAIIASAVLMLALSLLTIVARSPYTHANLDLTFDPGYTRTEQTLVSQPDAMQRSKLAVPAASDPAQYGKQLFVVDGCAGCHGLDGRGGIIGPSLIGTTTKKLATMTRVGPKGMPSYAADPLSDADLAAIAAFLSAGGK